MDIKAIIEWIGHDAGSAGATIFPYLLVGLVGLYLLWLVIGYLRVSQVGIGTEVATQPAMPLPASAEGSFEQPKGVPYCPTDRLAFSAGARVCPRCEGDLLVNCANCGTTIQAADAECYSCGTRQTLARA